jgi:hypothetical protein
MTFESNDDSACLFFFLVGGVATGRVIVSHDDKASRHASFIFWGGT